ncbi:MAG TPA: tetratricopeptide repeat protein, partial [Anaerolineales bacterium]|nr:tetratricopeptide repeat protein [Anaerolineales bacterium]
RLDGLPLAIELAAARTRILPPAGLLDQLAARFDILTSRSRDIPERHRTLRSAVEWSFNLMAEEEKKLFTRLAIFPGGFSPVAVGAVLMPPETAHLALDVLELLAEKHIVQPDLSDKTDSPRFFMLATLRDYALERLQADAELPALYHRRGEYYANLADQAESELFGSDQARWLLWIQGEENNLRATLEWAFQPERRDDEIEMGTRIVCHALNRFWRMRGRLNEGQEWFARALVFKDRLSRKYQKKLAQHSAAFYVWQGEYDLARKFYETEYELAQAEGDIKARANLLQGLGLVAGHLSEYRLAEKYLSEAVMVERENSDGQIPYNLMVALSNLGIVYRHLGNYTRAIELQEEVLAYRLELGDEWGLASVLANIGVLEELQGQYEASLKHYRESMRIRQKLGDELGIVICLAGVASVLFRKNQCEESTRLYSFIWKLRQHYNYKASLENRLEEERHLNALRRFLGEPGFLKCWDEGNRMTMPNVMTQILEDDL